MFSLRSCARSAPRLLSQLSSKTIRTQPSLLRSTPILSTSWRQASTPKALASFHTSIARKDAASETVATNLQSELDYETEQQNLSEPQAYSQNIKDYLENSAFKLIDTPGSEEFQLVREFEDEKITVKFTINDMITEDPDNQQFDDQAMYDDEDLDADDIAASQSGGANTKGAINQGVKGDGNFKVAPEDRVAPADRPELEDEYSESEETPQNYPARTAIKIERPGKGAIAIDAITENGNIFIDNVYYFPDAALADPETSEQDWSRRLMYTGPKYNGLDEALQQSIENYLAERGINERMAVFIPDYIDYKENQEYVRWLKNMRNFFA